MSSPRDGLRPPPPGEAWRPRSGPSAGGDRDPAVGRRGALSETALLAVLAVLGVAYVAQALRIGVGDASAPGSGLYPALVGAVFTVVSLARIAWLRRAQPAATPEGREDPRTPPIVYAMFCVLIGFGLAQAIVGFVPALGLMIAVALAVTGYGNWRRRILVAIVASVLAALVFQRWLQVPFPKGLLGDWLG